MARALNQSAIELHNQHDYMQFDATQHRETPSTRLLHAMRQKIDPPEDEKNSWPTIQTAIMAVSGLGIFALVGFLVIGFPTKAARIVLPIIALLVDVCILLAVYRDISSKKTMRPNVANTVLLSFLITILMTFLYEFVWYGQRNATAISLSVERSDNQTYPGVLVMMLNNYPAQARVTLQPPPLCIVGMYNEQYEPKCDTMTAEEMLNITRTGTCDCGSYWDTEIRTQFPPATEFDYLTFLPGEEMVTDALLAMMNLVVYFNFNSTTSIPGPVKFNPSLWILIFDRSKSPEEGYIQAQSEFTLIDANSQILVELSPISTKNEARSSTSAANDTLNYNSRISTIHNLDQPCDLAHNSTAFCQAHISIRFATFNTTVSTVHDEKSFGETIESVGAFFALGQIVSWVFSGLAWVH